MSTEDVAVDTIGSAEAALNLARLLFTSRTWMHRRVERYVVEPTSECTRYISVDFTLPAHLAVKGSYGRKLVPLGLMRKGPLAAFSVQGPTGRPVPTLEREANAEWAVKLLVSMAEELARSREAVFDVAEFGALCHRVVLHSGSPDAALDGQLRSLLSPLSLLEATEAAFCKLVLQFESNFLLLVELDDEFVGRRTIVKYNYREPRPSNDLRPHRPRLEWEVPEFGAAASAHFEFSPPPLLLAYGAQLRQIVGTEETIVASSDVATSTVHLVARPEHRFVRGRLSVALIPRPYGAITAMRFGAWVVAAVLALGMVLRALRNHHSLPVGVLGAGPPSALLAAGGLLLTWVARAPEDWTTSQILLNARRSILGSAFCAVAVAGYLAVPIGDAGLRNLGWFVLGFVTLLNLAAAELLWRQCRLPAVPSSLLPRGDDDDAADDGTDKEGRPDPQASQG